MARSLCLMLIVACGRAEPPRPAPPRKPAGEFEEALLLRWTLGEQIADGDVSPDGAAAAFVMRRPEGDRVRVGDLEGPLHPRIGRPWFSPDGKRVKYAVAGGDEVMTVADGKVRPATDEDRWDRPAHESGSEVSAVSRDGRRVAYAARRGKTATVFVDGKAVGEYDRVTEIAFSPDAKVVAWIAVDGGRASVVVDGVAGEPCDEARDLIVGPDGRAACAVRRGGSWFVLWGGAAGEAFDDIPHDRPDRMYGFSADGRVLAHSASKGRVVSIVAGGKSWGRPGVFPGFPAVSADGRKARFAAIDIAKREIRRRVMNLD